MKNFLAVLIAVCLTAALMFGASAVNAGSRIQTAQVGGSMTDQGGMDGCSGHETGMNAMADSDADQCPHDKGAAMTGGQDGCPAMGQCPASPQCPMMQSETKTAAVSKKSI